MDKQICHYFWVYIITSQNQNITNHMIAVVSDVWSDGERSFKIPAAFINKRRILIKMLNVKDKARNILFFALSNSLDE